MNWQTRLNAEGEAFEAVSVAWIREQVEIIRHRIDVWSIGPTPIHVEHDADRLYADEWRES
jgi:hypothetical protein